MQSINPSFLAWSAAQICAKTITRKACQNLPSMFLAKTAMRPIFLALSLIGSRILLNRYDQKNEQWAFNGLKTFTTTLAMDATLIAAYSGYNAYVQRTSIKTWMKVALTVTSTLVLYAARSLSSPVQTSTVNPQSPKTSKVNTSASSPAEKIAVNPQSLKTPEGKTPARRIINSAIAKKIQQIDQHQKTVAALLNGLPQSGELVVIDPITHDPYDSIKSLDSVDSMIESGSSTGSGDVVMVQIDEPKPLSILERGARQLLDKAACIGAYAQRFLELEQGVRENVLALVGKALELSTIDQPTGMRQLVADYLRHEFETEVLDRAVTYRLPCTESEMEFFKATKFFEGFETCVHLVLFDLTQEDELEGEDSSYVVPTRNQNGFNEEALRGSARFAYVTKLELIEGQRTMAELSSTKATPIDIKSKSYSPIPNKETEVTDLKARKLISMLQENPGLITNFATHFQWYPKQQKYLLELFDRALKLSIKTIIAGKQICELQQAIIKGIFENDADNDELPLACTKIEAEFYRKTSLFKNTKVKLIEDKQNIDLKEGINIDPSKLVSQYAYVTLSSLQSGIKDFEAKKK